MPRRARLVVEPKRTAFIFAKGAGEERIEASTYREKSGTKTAARNSSRHCFAAVRSAPSFRSQALVP
jgi:hypothetical protein